MPTSVQKNATGHIIEIYTAETKKNVEAAFGFFVKAYRATKILVKDLDELMAFYEIRPNIGCTCEPQIHLAIENRRNLPLLLCV